MSNKHFNGDNSFRTRLLSIIAALFLLSSFLYSQENDRQEQTLSTKYTLTIEISPRHQWNANYGYCGETCFISASMYYGQYCSQYTARHLASPDLPQNDVDSQLLLGVNDIATARKMRLEAVEFYNPIQRKTPEFMSWIKSNFIQGNVVIIGVYNNVYLLEEPESEADPEYDHIVPVLEIGSNHPIDTTAKLYYSSDVITISDNALYGPVGTPPEYPLLYSYRFGKFKKSRKAADSPRGPVYSLCNKPPNYGVTITGISDLDSVTIPVRLTSDLDYEPEMEDNSDTPPTPIDMNLTATVTIKDEEKAYKLYRYDDFEKVPSSNFNALASYAVESWDIPAGSSSYTVEIKTKSDQTVIFRAVPADAP